MEIAVSDDIITFRFEDREIQANKSVLVQHSPVFAKMLTSSYIEAQSKRGVIKEISPDVFQMMINFMSSEELPQPLIQHALKLYEAAHYYEIKDLKEICRNCIRNSIVRFTDPLELYAWIHVYNFDEIKNEVWIRVKR
jgi:hypothetical protein